MKENDTDTTPMLHNILRYLDIPITVFNADRKIIYSNHGSEDISQSSLLAKSEEEPQDGDVDEAMHFEENEYYDISGNLLQCPKDSPLQHAIGGRATHDLLLEHRNKKNHRQRWLLVSCVPVRDEQGKFLYGILWYKDTSACIAHENKLKFLVSALRVLSLDPNIENRLEQNAKLLVPMLADWISIDVVSDTKTSEGAHVTKNIALYNKDPQRMDLYKKYTKKYLPYDSPKSMMQLVITTQKSSFTPTNFEDLAKANADMSEERRADTLALGISSYMMVPIILDGKTSSVMTLAFAESGRLYSQEDVTFMEEFAHYTIPN